MFLNGAYFYNLQEVLVYARINNDFYARRGGWRYFVSESKLQWYMYLKGVNNIFRCFVNILIRLVIQVIIPNSLRKKIFITFFRQ